MSFIPVQVLIHSESTEHHLSRSTSEPHHCRRAVSSYHELYVSLRAQAIIHSQGHQECGSRFPPYVQNKHIMHCNRNISADSKSKQSLLSAVEPSKHKSVVVH